MPINMVFSVLTSGYLRWPLISTKKLMLLSLDSVPLHAQYLSWSHDSYLEIWCDKLSSIDLLWPQGIIDSANSRFFLSIWGILYQIWELLKFSSLICRYNRLDVTNTHPLTHPHTAHIPVYCPISKLTFPQGSPQMLSPVNWCLVFLVSLIYTNGVVCMLCTHIYTGIHLEQVLLFGKNSDQPLMLGRKGRTRGGEARRGHAQALCQPNRGFAERPKKKNT